MSNYQKNYNKKGDSSNTPTFQDILGYSDGLIAVKQNNLYGFIDIHGEWRIPCQYQSVSLFEDGVAIVSRNNLYGLIDKQGNEILAPQHKKIHLFSEGLAEFEANIAPNENNRLGFLDQSGATVIPPQYCAVGAFKDGLAHVSKEDEDGYISHAVYINKQGEVVIDIENEEAYSFNDGYAILQVREREGAVINTKGEIVHFWRGNFDMYDEDETFCTNGILHIKSYDDDETQTFTYDLVKKESINIDPELYEIISFFCDGYAVVASFDMSSQYGCIDKEGHEIIPCMYDDLYYCEGRFVAKKGEVYGVIDLMNKEVVPFIYSNIDLYVGEYTVATIKDNFILLDNKGNHILTVKNDKFKNPKKLLQTIIIILAIIAFITALFIIK